MTADDDGVQAGPDDGPATVDVEHKEAPVRLAGAVRRFRVATCALVAAALVGGGVAGCGVTHVQTLDFRVDHRLHFLSPKDRSSTHFPLTIRWRMSGFTVAPQGSAPPSGAAGYFVLFVDQAPVRPGQPLKSVCTSDPFERGDRNCPTVKYLEGKQIYQTTDEQVTLASIPNLPGNKDKKQLHSFIVVLMDTAGRRIGESAWELDVRLPRIGA